MNDTDRMPDELFLYKQESGSFAVAYDLNGIPKSVVGSLIGVYVLSHQSRFLKK